MADWLKLMCETGKHEENSLQDRPPPSPGKRIGILAGKLIIPDDFDAPLPEDLQKAFEAPLTK